MAERKDRGNSADLSAGGCRSFILFDFLIFWSILRHEVDRQVAEAKKALPLREFAVKSDRSK